MQNKNEITTNKFKSAIENTYDVKDGYCIGLRALKSNASHVSVEDTRKLEGSLDIDSCTKNIYPNDSRWDYSIGYDGKAYFLEVHPASTSNVKHLIKKAESLSIWLRNKAPELKKLMNNEIFYWVASGKQSILPNSVQSRQLAQSHIRLVKCLELPVRAGSQGKRKAGLH